MRKRTRQIDESREIQIGGTKSHPTWTTAGELAMNGDENVELSHNLRMRRRAEAVNKVVQQLLEGFAAWLETCILDLAPKNVFASYSGRSGDGQKLFHEWLARVPFKFVMDGLTARFFYNGKELASTTAKVDPMMEAEVLSMMKFKSILAKFGGKGS